MSEKQITVGEIESYIASLAPVETAEEYDNVGLLIGKRDTVVEKALVALDLTLSVVKEAEKLGVQLIITHHPLFFHARKNLVEEEPEALIACEMVRQHMALISAHTNLDQTEFSGSACTARALKLQSIRQNGYIFLGELPEVISARELSCTIESVLRAPIRIYGDGSAKIKTLAISGGAYDEGYKEAMQLGAQALLTGEVRHHNAIAAAMENFVLLDGTHYATEAILVPNLANALQKAFSALKYTVNFYPSSAAIFAGGGN